ncbi:MAG: hypothetical protein IPN95_27050 [Bacteroidetes bacterium]|nr:hypothetical protein [Bacteroidota bacterium]
MGFNIGVSANMDDFEAEMECDKFLERTFYNWVVEFDNYGDQSCIIQTGKYFGMDLKPLTILIYTNGELDADYIQSGLQNTDFLIDLVSELIKNVSAERNFIEKIQYEIKSGPTDEERQMLIKAIGHDPFPKYENPDPNPWKKYVMEGDFLGHLNILKESLECFKSKGQKKVFLTAG